MKLVRLKNFGALPCVICFFLLSVGIKAQETERLINLKGLWKFSIGDDMDWASPSFNDSGWEIVKVPSGWESEGFHGYDGYAWYRKSFRIPSAYRGRSITLKIGRIDDVDEVFFNGELIGFTGRFPPLYKTAYWAFRQYAIPASLINYDKENVVTVRVYDSELEGGILEGDIGIYELKNWDLNLSGVWEFTTEDRGEFRKQDFDDKNWESIIVPGNWESQGYEDYDGYAWYRIKFTVPVNLKGKKLLLVAGKIDDFDQVYFNGQLIGTTGPIDNLPRRMDNRGEWQKLRNYSVPENIIRFGGVNTIAIRVYDGYINGGIYEGPLGLITQENYSKFWRREKSAQRENKNLWERFWEELFD